MKASLEHLPEPKREQLGAVAALLEAEAPVEMVILFGSYARGDWVADPEGGYYSDFDLQRERLLADRGLLGGARAAGAGRVPAASNGGAVLCCNTDRFCTMHLKSAWCNSVRWMGRRQRPRWVRGLGGLESTLELAMQPAIFGSG